MSGCGIFDSFYSQEILSLSLSIKKSFLFASTCVCDSTKDNQFCRIWRIINHRKKKPLRLTTTRSVECENQLQRQERENFYCAIGVDGIMSRSNLWKLSASETRNDSQLRVDFFDLFWFVPSGPLLFSSCVMSLAMSTESSVNVSMEFFPRRFVHEPNCLR